MKKYSYLFSLFATFIIPTVIISFFVFNRINIFNLLTFVLGITILGSIWDIWATKHGKKDRTWLWQFNYKETVGIKIFDLPIEEYIFYIGSSTYIIFIWEGIKLAKELQDIKMFVLLPFLGVWTSLIIGLSYYITNK